MDLLSPITEPPQVPLRRRHRPGRVADYEKYRACLRWDFGFHCAFCLIHERDLCEHGARGSGQWWIEHLALQSMNAAAAGNYDNCFYACRYCNHDRGTSPITSGEARLLNPVDDAWAKHFVTTDEACLRPVEGDADAAYTWKTYSLDNPVKVRCRRNRLSTLKHHLGFILEAPERIERLLSAARLIPIDGVPEGERLRRLQARLDLHREARRIQEAMDRALTDLRRFRAVPEDKDDRCLCGTNVNHSLPPEFARQVRRITPPATSAPRAPQQPGAARET